MRTNKDDRSDGMKRVDRHLDKMRDRINTVKGQLKSLPVDVDSKVAERVKGRLNLAGRPAIEVY